MDQFESFECDICYESYTETGCHVPLVLPCGHTLCKICLEQLPIWECPTCKYQLPTSETSSLTFPRNNWLIRYMATSRTCVNFISSQVASETPAFTTSNPVITIENPVITVGKPLKYVNTNRVSIKRTAVGQTLLYKQLNRAFREVSQTKVAADKKEERDFLINLTKICKEKKIQNQTFDQKRFVRESLMNKYGEEKANCILRQVYDRIELLRNKEQVKK